MRLILYNNDPLLYSLRSTEIETRIQSVTHALFIRVIIYLSLSGEIRYLLLTRRLGRYSVPCFLSH